MNGISAKELGRHALDAGLLTTSQLDSIWEALGSHEIPLPHFIMYVVGQELLTNFQIMRLNEKAKRDDHFFGPYKIQYLLRAERLARVYRAVHTESQQIVAVKVLRRIHRADSDARDEFCLEAKQLACQVDTPNDHLYMVLDGSRN